MLVCFEFQVQRRLLPQSQKKSCPGYSQRIPVHESASSSILALPQKDKAVIVQLFIVKHSYSMLFTDFSMVSEYRATRPIAGARSEYLLCPPSSLGPRCPGRGSELPIASYILAELTSDAGNAIMGRSRGRSIRLIRWHLPRPLLSYIA